MSLQVSVLASRPEVGTAKSVRHAMCLAACLTCRGSEPDLLTLPSAAGQRLVVGGIELCRKIIELIR